MTPPLRFNRWDIWRARRVWGADGSTAALAAATGRSLDDVRPYMAELKRTADVMAYIPVMMALSKLGAKARFCGPGWPFHGLMMISWWGWDGKYYSKSTGGRHWIAISDERVFDANNLALGYPGWVHGLIWEERVFPRMTAGAKEPGWDRKWTPDHWRRKNKIPVPGEWCDPQGIEISSL